jgi:hypothetical protein
MIRALGVGLALIEDGTKAAVAVMPNWLVMIDPAA